MSVRAYHSKKCVYMSLLDDLRRDIPAGLYRTDIPLPGELELAGRYKISRQSVRKALQILESEKLIRRFQGSGTFATPPSAELSHTPRRSRTFYFLQTHLDDGFSQFERDFWESAIECAELSGFHPVMRNSSSESAESLIDAYRSGAVDALLWSGGTPANIALASQCRESGIPQLTVHFFIPGIPSIDMDSAWAMNKVVSFLYSCGHENIGFLNADVPVPAHFERERYFFEQMHALHLPTEGRYKKLQSWHHIHDFALLGAFVAPLSALILGGHGMLPFFLRWSEQERVHIPEQLSLICFDDSLFARNNVIPVTVLSQSRCDTGRKAVRMLEMIMNNQLSPQEQVRLRGDLILRDSVRIIR